MSSGFTLLAIGSLVLLMITVINANRLIVNADVQPTASEQYSQMVSLSEAMFGELRTRKFDEQARDTLVLTPSSFTPPTLLGPDGGAESDSCPVPDYTDYRSARWYNDIDDYNRYVRIVSVPGSVDYQISVKVYYVNENDFVTQSFLQTYLKKVVVTVENRSNLSQAEFSSMFAY